MIKTRNQTIKFEDHSRQEVKCTTCYMCACRCGIKVWITDGKIRYIQGNPAHPVNQGVLCAKGAAGIMQHYSPARLSKPLLRVGERGSGEFREIEWDEALQLATDWLAPIRARNPDELAFFTGRDQSQALTGWWAHAAPFAMAPSFAPGDGIRRALCGTQPVVSLALVECGLAIFAKTDMASIRRKSLALTRLFIELIDGRCADHPLTLVTPRAPEERGSHVSIAHPQGLAVMRTLIARGVIGDYREPAIMRFGFTPLYTRFVDVWDAVEILRDILDNRLYDRLIGGPADGAIVT